MKNITIALDDVAYRKARIAAARRDASVSALVKQYLISLVAADNSAPDFKQQQEALLDGFWNKYPVFTSSENLPREALHDRTLLP